jgi:hypothetical protein
MSGVVKSTAVVVVFDGVASVWYAWRALINTVTKFCTAVDWDGVLVSVPGC